jgi:hypothetical protein
MFAGRGVSLKNQSALLDAPDMEKKKGPQPSKSKQVAFRVPREVADELEQVGALYGLDLSNFMRLMVRKCLPIMKKDAEQFGEPWQRN